MRRTLHELARTLLVACLVGAMAAGPGASLALAGPEGAVVRRGNVTIDHVEGSTEWVIHAPNGSIIEYSSFDIAGGEARELVEFRQGGADSRVLNRIQSALPTRIDGTLLGDGHVYIVNPAGVTFGEGATVNVNGLHAAAGNLSDRDFVAGNDHYTGLRGRVENQAAILADAVSLVGAEVVNSGSILTKTGSGWIVLAAGEDVLIGLDSSGSGILLRIEGGARVFDPDTVGVSNTGTLGGDCTPAPCAADPRRISVGAGDLYGTAIFSSGAIRARETLALRAGERGDIALGGQVSAERLEVGLHGSDPGALRGADPAATTTVLADEVAIDAKSAGGLIEIGDGLALRSRTTPTSGPDRVEVSQTATLASSQLANLDMAAGADTTLRLESRAGDVVVDDKAVVAGTRLELEAGLSDLRGTDALQVASLGVTGSLVSDGDIVASDGDIAVTGDLLLVTKPEASEDDSVATLLSAHDGDLDVDGSIATDDGGRVRIEAENVLLGRLNSAGLPIAGAITSTGSVRGGVEIGFVEGGVQQTQTVALNGAIDTSGGRDGVAGGDVSIDATGDVRVGTIDTTGALSDDSDRADADGGSVRIAAGSGSTLRTSSIKTGGADLAAAGEVQHGEVALSAGTVVLSGSIDALADSAENAANQRDRDVRIDGALHLTADATTIDGSDVAISGRIEGRTPENAAKQVALDILSTGETRLTGGTDLFSLRVDSSGGDVVLGGDVSLDTSLVVTFATEGTGVLRGSGDPGAPTTVSANRVALTAAEPGTTSGTTAAIALGDDLAFALAEIPATSTAAAVAPSFSLQQDGALDAAAAGALFTPTRFTNGVEDLSIALGSKGSIELDAANRAALADSNLALTARSFTATGATGAASDFTLASLEVATGDALLVDFGVTADRARLQAGTTGTGDLTVQSQLHADEIALVAGNGIGGGSQAKVAFGTGAALRNRAGENAEHVELIQDAALATASLEDAARFGGSVAGMEYVLESREGSVTVSQGSAAQAKIAGSALTLRGQAGVDLGAETLELASLTAETPETLEIANRINAQPGGTVRLHAGTDGGGNLEIASRIAADRIELVAGSGAGSVANSQVRIETGAHFTGSQDELRPDAFLLQQDAAIGLSSASTQVPGRELFGDGNIDGMELALRSKGAGLRIEDVADVNGTALALEGRSGIDVGVDVNGSLDVVSLAITGSATASGNIDADGDVSVGQLTFDGEGDQALVSTDGVLTATGPIAKSRDGALELEARQVTVGAITTAHTGDKLTVTGRDGITTGAIDASGLNQLAGGEVEITSTNGAVTVASISTVGSNGRPAERGRASEAGSAGGAITVSGTALTLGNVNSSGGNAGAIDSSDLQTVARGGDAGAIELGGTDTVPAPEIVLRGSVTAVGGTGASPDANALDALRGAAADVTLEGPVRLAANRATTGGNEIRGKIVTLHQGASRAADRAAGETSLTIVAEDGLSIGGNLSAGRVDLELHGGNLDLAPGVSRIDADHIRLAATDGQGGDPDSVVVLDGLLLANEAGTAAPLAFTLDQDAAIGGASGSALPDPSLFAGPIVTADSQMALGLISRDGTIELDAAQVALVTGTNLTLAANGRLDGPNGAGTGPNVRVSGADLDVKGLTLGTGSGPLGTAGGDAEIEQALRVGSLGLSTRGSVDVGREAVIAGSAVFNGIGDQHLAVGEGFALELGGLTTSKTSDGALHLIADRIELTGTSGAGQTIENRRGQLEIDAALVKGSFREDGTPIQSTTNDLLTLRGFTTDASQPAIVVHGTRALHPAAPGEYALAVADGDLVVDARVLDDAGQTARWSLDGDVLAYGDISMTGAGVLRGGSGEAYTIEARREEATATTPARGGEVALGGIAETDRGLVVVAEGDVPSDSIPNPTAIALRGNYDVTGPLTLAGQVGTTGATRIEADDTVEFTNGIQGTGSLDVRSTGGAVLLRDDVALGSAAAFAASGETGVLFASDASEQSITAGSISLGGDAPRPPSGQASLFRDGDLSLRASTGNVTVGANQTLVVAGDLAITAAGTTTLADTAALRLDVAAADIAVHGGSTVMANRIIVSNRPQLAGGGGATFATPTGAELSDEIPGDDIVVRAIRADGSALTYAELASGEFPDVTGPARFDYARQTVQAVAAPEIAVPRADVLMLQAALRSRPLWAEELVAYLDARARRAPDANELVPLPPVAAGPEGALPAGDARLRSAAVEQAAGLYRSLFFPDSAIDPETGFMLGEDHEREIRESFQVAVDLLRKEQGRSAVSGAELAARIDADPRLGQARAYKRGLAELCAAARPALASEQQPRFAELLLARVAPHGVAPAELGALIR